MDSGTAFLDGLDVKRRGCIDQRESTTLKPNRTMVKVSCVCGYWTRTSPYWIRKWTNPKCDCCGGLMLPARIEDCIEYLPREWAAMHPDYADYVREREPKARKDYGATCDPGCCAGCGWPRHESASPDHFYCAKCRGVTTVDPLGNRHIEYPKNGDVFRSHLVKIARENRVSF